MVPSFFCCLFEKPSKIKAKIAFYVNLPLTGIQLIHTLGTEQP